MLINLLLLFSKFLIAVVLTEAITNIVSKSGFFLPFREFLDRYRNKLFIFRYLNDLVTCPYCFSVWAAIFSVIALGLSVKTVFLDPYFGYFLIGLVVHRISNISHHIIDRLDPKINEDLEEVLELFKKPEIKGFNDEEKD